MLQASVMLVILVAIYGAILAGLVWAWRKWRAVRNLDILLSFLVFGLGTGILAAWLWPNDSSVLPNIFGVWLGDWAYVHAIEWIGDPHSAQAHETIPWLFQVPQVYVTASTAWCAGMGLLLQWTLGRSPKP